MRIPKVFEPLADYVFLKLVNNINWKWARKIIIGQYNSLTFEDKTIAEKIIIENEYLICLTRQSSYLTTILISLATYIVSRKKTYYTHALMFERGTAFEATAIGTHLSAASHIIECDGIVFLRPTGMTQEFWVMMLEEARRNLDRPYDSLFDLSNDREISCIEYVYDSMKTIPGYMSRWPTFMGMVEKQGNITPQMLLDSGDFEIVLEIRR